MARYNAPRDRRTTATSPVVTETTPSGTTYEGAPGFARAEQGELFLLAASNMMSGTFYEDAQSRDERFERLVHNVAVDDPEWMLNFVTWLRGEANMRTASLVAALEATKAMLDAGVPGGRQIVRAAMLRADEPGEALAYWTGKYGRQGRIVPMPVKKGIADAAVALYDEYAAMKWDSAARGFRFGDVIEVTHPHTTLEWQNALFTRLLDTRHGHANGIPDSLPMMQANAQLREEAKTDPSVLTDTGRLRKAGMTWEDVLSMAGSNVDKRLLWEAMVPGMGYMALMRNLRNFDEAGVTDAVAADVCGRLKDPANVARSRQLPFRFLSAYRNVPSDRWANALEVALNLAVSNVPVIPGKTLILSDTSGSMTMGGISARSSVRHADVAALFAVVLGQRCGPENVDLYGFANGQFEHKLAKGGSVLKQVDKFVNRFGEVGHGTQMHDALAATFRPGYHDRVVIFSDMQAFRHDGTLQNWGGRGPGGTVDSVVDNDTPVYGWNLAGYKHGVMPTGKGNRHEVGGFSDSAFKLLPLLERGESAPWPWEVTK